MLCDKCGKNVASYHSTVNVNGNITSSHLCGECAAAGNKASQTFSLGNFFATPFLSEDSVTKYKKSNSEKVCGFCKKSFADFMQEGVLGCAKCYEAFSEQLLPIISTMQPSTEHVGRPFGASSALSAEELEVKNLEFKLKQAVANENYELASELKKRIISLRNEGGAHEL